MKSYELLKIHIKQKYLNYKRGNLCGQSYLVSVGLNISLISPYIKRNTKRDPNL